MARILGERGIEASEDREQILFLGDVHMRLGDLEMLR